MNHKQGFGLLVLASIGLCACVSNNPYGYTNYHIYTQGGEVLYPNAYPENIGAPESMPQIRTQNPVVPETFHMNTRQAPSSFKMRDAEWLKKQPAGAYTIELLEDQQASKVAGQLLKAPKTEHTAEIQYQKGGTSYYKGLYGSFPSQEAAQKALEQLPAELKKQATVRAFSAIP